MNKSTRKNDLIDMIDAAQAGYDKYEPIFSQLTAQYLSKMDGDIEDSLVKRSKSHIFFPKINSKTKRIVVSFQESYLTTDSFAKINFYNESYKTTQDYELWFRAIGAGLKFHNLQEILLEYRMDENYIKRKSLKYRLYDFKLRLNGFKYIDLPFYKYYYSLIPLILGVIPNRFYYLLKNIDPRGN